MFIDVESISFTVPGFLSIVHITIQKLVTTLYEMHLYYFI